MAFSWHSYLQLSTTTPPQPFIMHHRNVTYLLLSLFHLYILLTATSTSPQPVTWQPRSRHQLLSSITSRTTVPMLPISARYAHHPQTHATTLNTLPTTSLLLSPKESQNLPMRNSFIGTDICFTTPLLTKSFVSPQKGVEHKKLYSEMGVSHFAARSVILQANRALEVMSTALQGRSLMVDNEGRAVGADADRVGLLGPARELRLVGDIKPSWKWQSAWRHAPLHSAYDTSIGRFFHS